MSDIFLGMAWLGSPPPTGGSAQSTGAAEERGPWLRCSSASAHSPCCMGCYVWQFSPPLVLSPLRGKG